MTSLSHKIPRPLKSLIVAVVLPTLVVFFYLFFCHSSMYESQTVFAVRSAAETVPSLDFTSQIFKTNSSSIQDARIVDAYVRSADAFEQLDKKLQLVSHFSNRAKDPVSRLCKNPTRDEKQRFWAGLITPMLDTDSGILTFKVRAYTPEMALAITRGIIAAAEDLVNSMNVRSREDTLTLAREEVVTAKKQLADAQEALRKFRDAKKDIDLKSTVTGLQSVVIRLEEERAKTSAQLAEAASFMKPNAPKRKALRARLAALDSQIRAQKGRLSDSNEMGNLNSQVSEYEKLTLEHEFAQKQMTSALSALENARVTMLSKTRYLVPIQAPTLPDESLYPRPIQFSSVFGFVLFLLYGLLSLVIASIREHMGF